MADDRNARVAVVHWERGDDGIGLTVRFAPVGDRPEPDVCGREPDVSGHSRTMSGKPASVSGNRGCVSANTGERTCRPEEEGCLPDGMPYMPADPENRRRPTVGAVILRCALLPFQTLAGLILLPFTLAVMLMMLLLGFWDLLASRVFDPVFFILWTYVLEPFLNHLDPD